MNFVYRAFASLCRQSSQENKKLKAESARLNNSLQQERVMHANTTVNRDHWQKIAEEYYENCTCRKRRLSKKCGSCDTYEKSAGIG